MNSTGRPSDGDQQIEVLEMHVAKLTEQLSETLKDNKKLVRMNAQLQKQISLMASSLEVCQRMLDAKD